MNNRIKCLLEHSMAANAHRSIITRNRFVLRAVTVLALLGASSSGLCQSPPVLGPPMLNSVNNQTQTPIAGAGHDYQHLLGETVNFSNGSVSLKMGFPVPDERGISLHPAWSYNSASVNPLDAVDGDTPTWDNPANHFWPKMDGWSLAEGWPTASVQVWSVSAQFPGQTVIPCNYQSGMTFTDMSGTTHNLNIGAQSYAYINSADVQTCAGVQVTLPPNGDGQVAGTLFPETASEYLSQTMLESGEFVVTDKNGTNYYFIGGYTPQNAGSVLYAGAIEDRNGNIIGDTGQPVQFPNGNNSNSAFSIDNIEYTPTWTTTPVNYTVQVAAANPNSGNDIGCEPFPTTVSGSRNVLKSLTFTAANEQPQSYQFSYNNSFGLLSQVTYPDGGTVSYTYALPSGYNEFASMGGWIQISCNGTSCIYQPVPFGCTWQYQTPVLASRTVTFNGSAVVQTQNFSYGTTWTTNSSGGTNGWSSKTTTAWTTDNVLNQTSATVYTYTPYTPPPQPFSAGFTTQAIPMESTVTSYDWGQAVGNNPTGTPLKTVTKTWLDQFNMTSIATTINSASNINKSGNTSRTVYTYNKTVCGTPFTDAFTFLQEQDDYDFGASTPTRSTHYYYQCFSPTNALTVVNPATSATNSSPSFPTLGLPPQLYAVITTNASNSIVSAAQFAYDGSGLSAIQPLPTGIDSGTITISGNNINTGYVTSSGSSLISGRANLTKAIHCNPLPSSLPSSIALSSPICSAGPTVTYTYDITGQPATMTDACGNGSCTDMPSAGSHTTTFSFMDNPGTGNCVGSSMVGSTNPAGNTNAYLTSITYPLGSGTFQKTFQYNYQLGYLTCATDQNGHTTQYTYGDPLFRVTQINYPDGGQTTISYTDVPPNPTITTSKCIATTGAGCGSGAPLVTNVSKRDGMEHEIETQLTTDPDAPNKVGDTVLTTYDGEGRVHTKTNPFSGSSPPSGTTTTYYTDAAGRQIKTVEQDGSILQWCYNNLASVPAATNCSNILGSSRATAGSVTGTWVDSTDEVGNHAQHVSDAFGRLTQVMEPSGASQPQSGTPSLETDYAYDTLGNLLTVSQWGGSYGSSNARIRQFAYDSLSRLITSLNPEAGPVSYSYDLNSNVQMKTDARGISVNYQYNAINQLLQKNYSNDPSGTPTSCYLYGTTSPTSDLLTDSWTQTASTCAFSNFITHRHISIYDAMNRVQNEQQFTPAILASGQTYAPAYNYDEAGNLITWTDGITPSPTASGYTLTFTNTMQGANRVQSTASNWQDSTHPSLLFSTQPSSTPSSLCANATSGPQYTPFGTLNNATFGVVNSSSGPYIAFNRAYDGRMRVTCEYDQGYNAAGTPGTATVTITGSEQSK
jgi:YD repeat-containing protein